jgi:hypothetical protein
MSVCKTKEPVFFKETINSYHYVQFKKWCLTSWYMHTSHIIKLHDSCFLLTHSNKTSPHLCTYELNHSHNTLYCHCAVTYNCLSFAIFSTSSFLYACSSIPLKYYAYTLLTLGLNSLVTGMFRCR